MYRTFPATDLITQQLGWCLPSELTFRMTRFNRAVLQLAGTNTVPSVCNHSLWLTALVEVGSVAELFPVAVITLRAAMLTHTA